MPQLEKKEKGLAPGKRKRDGVSSGPPGQKKVSPFLKEEEGSKFLKRGGGKSV